jgi:hypothetical protein
LKTEEKKNATLVKENKQLKCWLRNGTQESNASPIPVKTEITGCANLNLEIKSEYDEQRGDLNNKPELELKPT